MSSTTPLFGKSFATLLKDSETLQQDEEKPTMDQDIQPSNKRKRDIDDDGDVDDDEAGTPYDERQEPFPSHPAFDPRIAEMKARATIHLNRLSEHLAESEQSHPALQHMRGKAQNAAEMREPDRQMIALVGDAGAGKSSVLNAVVDIPELARVVAGGESCTTVPTLYFNRLPLQSKDKPFAAGVRYLTPEDCTLLMQELLDDYNLWAFESDDAWSLEQRSEYSQAATTAIQTFRTLFCDQAEFATESAAELTLENDYNAPSPTLVNKMTEWCEALLETAEDNSTEDSYRFAEFDDVKSLSMYVDEWTLPSEEYEKLSMWPLVERVSIGAQTSRLLEWITITDLAGLTDTHKVRVKATHKYIAKCNAMWYVAGVERVTTDPNLDKTISIYAERFPNTLAIIVTKIDRGIDDALAREMKKKKVDMSVYDFLCNQLRDLAKGLKKDQTRLNKLMTSGSRDYFALAKKVEEDNAKSRQMVLERTAILVQARGEFISRRLREDKQKYLPEGLELPVYCVSNSQYFAHKLVDDADEIIMEPATTGIPELRAYALELAAPSIWEETKAYLTFSVAGFLHGANAWAEAEHKQRRTGLLQCVNTAQKNWNFLIDPVPQQVHRLLENDFIQTIRAAHNKSQEGALRALQTIESWNSGSFLAFFRKHGKHYTRTIGKECWNQMFLQTQTDSFLLPAWERVMPQLQDIIRTAVKQISKSIQDLPERLERNPGSAPLPVGTFQDMLRPHIVGIDAALHRRSRQYEHDLSNIKLDSTIDQPSSYFTHAMTPVYEEHKRNGGPGSAARWKHALREHLSLLEPKSPFSKATNELAKALTSVAKVYVSGIRADIQGILDDITQQMTSIMACGVETEEEAASRKALLGVLRDSMPEIKRIEREVRRLDGKR